MDTDEEIRRLEGDTYRWVYEASERHRAEHGPGCHVYPTSSGPLLGWLARLIRPQRTLEVGCGLGYSALWIAHGSAPEGHVETVERVPEHAELAKAHFEKAAASKRVTVHIAGGRELLPALEGPYQFVFLDGDWWEYPDYLPHLLRLVPPGGVIISSNIFPHEIGPDMPGLEEAAEYCHQIFSHPGLTSTFIRGAGKALSLRI